MGVRQAVLVAGQTAVGVSRARNWYSASSGTMTVEVYFTAAVGTSCSKLVVSVEGSITYLNYFTLASHVLTATELVNKCCMFHIVSKPINSVRSNIITLTKVGGGDVEVTVAALSLD